MQADPDEEPMADSLILWLRDACSRYRVEPVAVYRASDDHGWPLVAGHESDLQMQLQNGGHFLPLPKEPAALANILEVSLVDFILGELRSAEGATAERGTERGYPDIEITGENLALLQFEWVILKGNWSRFALSGRQRG
jgi:hypothetical protein